MTLRLFNLDLEADASILTISSGSINQVSEYYLSPDPPNSYFFLTCHSSGTINNWVMNVPTISTQTGFTSTDACYDLDNNQVWQIEPNVIPIPAISP
jgi:hypothetical protein